MNRSGDSPTVRVQICAPDGRLDAALAGRVASAVIGALSDHTGPRSGPATSARAAKAEAAA